MTILAGMLGTLLVLLFGAQVLYILLLTVAALFYRKPAPGQTQLERVIILIPAHNEALTLPGMLEPIKALSAGPGQPKPAIVVIADNCTDNTAALARAAAVTVYERNNSEARGKGYALEWAIAQLPQDFPDYTACVILDADTLPHPDFLQAARAALSRGAQVVQGRYDVLSPFQNWRTLMQYTAAALAQHVRPMGRMVLGLSETLHGNGMVFRRELLERVPWQAYGLVEDMEYALRLTRQGYRIEYASDAIIYTQAPTTGEQALSQRLRWEGGRGSQARQNLLPLFRQAFQKRSLILLDRAFDLLVPPLALLVMSVTGVALLNLFLWVWLGGNWSAWNAILGLALMAGLVLYVIGGLLVARVPWRAFVMLSFAPFYLLFKLRVYATLLFRHVPVEWVRTPRTSIKD